MFTIPYHQIEKFYTGIDKEEWKNSDSNSFPIYLTPHFIKKGKELTVDDDIRIFVNSGSPYRGFYKTKEDLKKSDYPYVGWHYLNLKDIRTIYTRDRAFSYSVNSIFNRDKGMFGAQTNQTDRYIYSAFDIPLYLFVKDEKLNKMFFVRAQKICHKDNKLYPVFLNQAYKKPYLDYILSNIKPIFPKIDSLNGNIYFITIDNNDYLVLPVSDWYNMTYTFKLPIDLKNPKKLTEEEIKTIGGDLNNINSLYNNYNLTNHKEKQYLYYMPQDTMPEELKSKIVGVTNERGFPLFKKEDLEKHHIYTFNNGHIVQSDKTILDVPYAVMQFTPLNYSYTSYYGTINNMTSVDSANISSYQYFYNFTEFWLRNPINGKYYTLYGYNCEDRPVVLNHIEPNAIWYGENTIARGPTIIYLKPQVIDNDYGLSMVLFYRKLEYKTTDYKIKRPELSFLRNDSFKQSSYSLYKIAFHSKDAKIYRTQKNKTFIYKDNPHLESQHRIKMEYEKIGQFAIFNKVPKNIIDNNNEWDETKDTRFDFECDGYRDIEVMKFLKQDCMQLDTNFDYTYSYLTEIKEQTPVTQLVDFKMKYISNQMQDCSIYIVDEKYFNAIGHKEQYKTLLPFRCIYFPVEDMWLYTSDGKLDKPNPKYFDGKGNFVFDIQKFERFYIKHCSKVFEVKWDTKKANPTDFKFLDESKQIKYCFVDSAIDYYGSIYLQYSFGIIHLYNIALDTEMK